MSIDLNWILSQPSDNYKTVTDLYLQIQLIKKVMVNNFSEKRVYFLEDHSIKDYISYIKNIPISTGHPKDSEVTGMFTFLQYYLDWSYRILGPWPILNTADYFNSNFLMKTGYTCRGPKDIDVFLQIVFQLYQGKISLSLLIWYIL